MILFFYGTNDYLLKQKLKALKDKYKEASKGSFDSVTLDGADLSYEKFTAQVQTVALFATTRLVVINQIFDCKKEVQDRLKEYLPNISKTTVVVFVHTGEPDKRLGFFKALNKPKISQHFKALESSEVETFIKEEARNRGADFEPRAISYLAQMIGPDPWQLAGEVEKLAVYRNGQKISSENIDEVVSANIFSNTFSLIDALVDRNMKKALKELEAVISVNEPPLKVLGAINYQFRLIAMAKDELERGTPSGALASKLKVNPYPLRKALGYVKRFSWSDLDSYYNKIITLDENIKTGKMIPEEALKDFVLNAK